MRLHSTWRAAMPLNEPPAGPTAGRVEDARRRKVSQLDPAALHVLRRQDLIDARTLQEIASEPGVRIKASERAALIGSICCAVVVIGLFTHAVVTGDIRGAASAKSVGMLYICSMPWIIWFGIRRKRLAHIAAAMLKHRRCPHCGYALNGLPADPDDGATVCPECGCAWTLAAIRTREQRQ
jgi:hypothetical protein